MRSIYADRKASSRSTACTPTRPVHDLRDAEVDAEAGERHAHPPRSRRARAPSTRASLRRAIPASSRCLSSKPSVIQPPSIRATGHSSTGSSGHVQRQLRARRRLDRGPGHLAVALHRMPVPGGEERAVDRDREIERRPGHELLAVHVPAPAPRRPGRVHARLGRRHAHHAEKRRELDLEAFATGRRRPRAPSESRGRALRARRPRARDRPPRSRTTSVWPAFAPRTRIGPASAWPSSSSGLRGAKLLVARDVPGVIRHRELAPSRRGRSRSTGSSVLREVPVQVSLLERQLVDGH